MNATDLKTVIPVLVATDLDGTFGKKVDQMPPSNPTICISGRTFAEYDSVAKTVAQQMPLYIRGVGCVGDRIAAGNYKATMISLLAVTHFLEDDPVQANIIRNQCPNVNVSMVIT
jgi:hypothetical protein